MKKNIKGFSLVELIGVIILLSVAALIIVPNVLSIIEKREQNAFEESVKGLIRSVQNYYASTGETFPEEGLEVTNIGFSVSNIEDFIDGIILEEDGTYIVSDVTNGIYVANGKRNSLSIDKYFAYEVDHFDFSDFSNWRTGQYAMESGVYQGYPDRLALNDYITCKPSATYKVTTSNDSYRLVIRLMDENKKFIRSVGPVASNGTFTTTSKTAYLAISLYSPNIYGLTYAKYRQLFESGYNAIIKEQ